MWVGVRELKAHLSEYLDRAASGETIVVTERGRAKAQIAPLTSATRLRVGIDEGWVTPPAKPGQLRGLVPPLRIDESIEELLAQDRAED